MLLTPLVSKHKGRLVRQLRLQHLVDRLLPIELGLLRFRLQKEYSATVGSYTYIK